MKQLSFFEDTEAYQGARRYKPLLTVVENTKGVLDVDTVKGCTLGLQTYPDGGCYGECYACKIASRYGVDFATSIARKMASRSRLTDIFLSVKHHYATWYRIGTAGDPCHDWDNTVAVCEQLSGTGKIPVIITKHWIPLSDGHLARLQKVSAVINTSTSGLDTDQETAYRVEQINRIKSADIKSVCRIVTCDFGLSTWAKQCREKQDYLLSLPAIIDNPLRASKSNPHVLNGDIILTRKEESIGGGKFVSLHDPHIYLEHCGQCPDQCGVTIN